MNATPPRTALVTGASRGLGAAMAAELRRRGLKVVTPTRAEMDLSRPESVNAYVDSHRDLPVDILVNNAGVNFLNPLAAVDAASWQTMLQTNLTSALQLIQAFAPGMATRGWGRIVSVSTIFSLVTKEKRAAYSMTKAALNALTR